MVSIFREKSIFNVFFLVLLGVAVHAHFWLHPPVVETGKQDGYLSLFLQSYISSLPSLLLSGLYLMLVFIQAFRLNYILNDLKMFQHTAFTTAAAYIMLTAVFKEWNNISPALISNTIIIWLFNKLARLYNNPHPKTLLFNIGLITGLAIVLYHPLIYLIPVILLGLAVLRPFRLAEWIMVLFGLITTYYFIAAALFLTDNMASIKNFIPQFHLHLLQPKHPVAFSISVIYIALLVMIGFVVWNQFNGRSLIQIRRNWGVLLIMIVFSIPSVFLYKHTSWSIALLSSTPAAAFIANLFLYPRKLYLPAILFWLLIALIVYNNWWVV